MIQNVIRSLVTIDIYGMVSLGIFTSIFTAVLVWACLLRRSHLDRMARVPLDAGELPTPSHSAAHE